MSWQGQYWVYHFFPWWLTWSHRTAYVDTRYLYIMPSLSPFASYWRTVSLVGTGNVDKAAIFNKEGSSVWASSQGFTVRCLMFLGAALNNSKLNPNRYWRRVSKVSPTEVQEIIASYTDTSDVKKIQSGGFRVAGEKYMTIKADEKSVYGKKVLRAILTIFKRLEKDVLTIATTGEVRCGRSQDPTSHSHNPLPGDCTARTGNKHSRAIGRLFNRSRLLGLCIPVLCYAIMKLYFANEDASL